MLMTELTGKEVLDVKANKVGNIIDVDLNIAQGTIAYFVLKTGVFKKVPLAADRIDKVGEKVILRVTKEEAESRPAGAVV